MILSELYYRVMLRLGKIEFPRIPDEFKTRDVCLTAIKYDNNSHLLAFIDNQTDEICLAAVRKCGSALRYVGRQTEEICLAAVRRDYEALRYVENQTDEICITAIREDWRAFKHVKNQTNKVCLVAIKHDWRVLGLIEIHTSDLCREALNQNPLALRYIKNNNYYNILDVKNALAEMKKEGKSYHLSDFGYRENTYTPIFENVCNFLLNLKSEDLVKAVNEDLREFLKEDGILKIYNHEIITAIEGKVKMLETSNINDKINNTKNKKII